MSLWWLKPGWTDACCSGCGARIYPEGDPDWGKCFQCFSAEMDENQRMREAEEQHYSELEAAAKSEGNSPA